MLITKAFPSYHCIKDNIANRCKFIILSYKVIEHKDYGKKFKFNYELIILIIIKWIYGYECVCIIDVNYVNVNLYAFT